MVLSPEHPLVDEVTGEDQAGAVAAYQEQAAAKDLVARQKVEKTKTGVDTGGHCLNPATGQPIPIWVADYVLMEYGTGAIMAVPGHDQRDFDFAEAMGLPIVRVVAGAGDGADTPLSEAYAGDGVMVNSGRFDGMAVVDAKPAISAWLAESGRGETTVNYRLHDWCISRQRYWGPPIPVIHCDACGPVAVPEGDLPVVLPRVEDFKPDDSGVSPLARVEEWYRIDCPQCGSTARRETDVSDTFLDSSWYFLRYPSTEHADVPFDGELMRRWLPVDCYIGGNEHAVLHLLYARFVTMALHDLGHLEFEEPFTRFRAHGMIIREGAKMSKSRGNVIVPDEIIEQYGADTFRTYLMFLGPYEEGGDYQDEGIEGPHGFLHRVYETVVTAVGGRREPRQQRGRRRSRARPGRRAQAPSDDPANYAADARARVQHVHRRHDGVPEHGSGGRTHGHAERGRAPGCDDRALRPAHGRRAVGTSGPREKHFRRSQLAGIRRVQNARDVREGGRPGEREAACHHRGTGGDGSGRRRGRSTIRGKRRTLPRRRHAEARHLRAQ